MALIFTLVLPRVICSLLLLQNRTVCSNKSHGIEINRLCVGVLSSKRWLFAVAIFPLILYLQPLLVLLESLHEHLPSFCLPSLLWYLECIVIMFYDNVVALENTCKFGNGKVEVVTSGFIIDKAFFLHEYSLVSNS